jgi:hypothetical protein
MRTSSLAGLLRSRWSVALLCIVLALPWCAATPAMAQVIGLPTLRVSGGIFLEDPAKFQPLLFTWLSPIRFGGENWRANDTVGIHLYGPLNTPGVPSSDYFLGLVFADNAGNIVAGIDYDPVLRIPFSQTVALPPGHYTVYGEEAQPPTPLPLPRATASDRINVGPRTIPFSFPTANGQFVFDFHWSSARGGRDGWLEDHSPERTDPQWASVWSERPVAVYGTIAAKDSRGDNQPSFISHEDFPSNHYAHDVDLMLLPDPEYRWILGDANFNGDPNHHSTGRIEVEWEAQNAGNPFSYGQGNIGMPLWAMPTAGDRVFIVGRWVMDNGHPDEGDRTEIHPPRMLATMRKHHTALPFCSGATTRASQLDVFVTGHGGGANQFPDGLSAAIDNNGLGGARLGDVLSDADRATYFAFGPAHDSTVIDLIGWYSGFNTSSIRQVAGPSGLGWGNGPEGRPINDMDYEFDAPLPAPPAGATSVQVQVITHPEHTTAVTETITYTDVDPTTGLPTKAHIRLPYNGADNGIYARTLQFYWNTFNPPGRHFVVRMNNLTFFPAQYWSGRAHVWADVGGQWLFLTPLNPDRFLHAKDTLGGDLPPDATWHLYLDPSQPLRVFTQGYDQQAFDELFGIKGAVNQTARSAYDVALDIVDIAIGSQISLNPSPYFGDSVDLGGALFEWPPIPTQIAAGGVVGRHQVLSVGPAANGGFYIDFNVSYVPAPPRIEVSRASVDFGSVCTASSQDQVIRVSNTGEEQLRVTAIAVSGAEFSLLPTSGLPLVVDGGYSTDLKVRFAPSGTAQSTGALTLSTNDPCQPTLTVGLTGTPIYPVTTLTGSLGFGKLPVGDHAPGSAKVLNFSIDAAGACPLDVNSVAITAGDTSDFHVLAPPTFPATIPPGGSLPVPVEFNPTKGGHRSATISVTVDNDPTHPMPLSISAEGGKPRH